MLPLQVFKILNHDAVRIVSYFIFCRAVAQGGVLRRKMDEWESTLVTMKENARSVPKLIKKSINLTALKVSKGQFLLSCSCFLYIFRILTCIYV